mgnify:FL=1
MDTEEQLEQLRELAKKEGKCFSKKTLKEKYRMKPSPTAHPVTYFENGFGGEFGVYRITDCVPMRAKSPVTEKQIEAGKKLGARSKLGSKKAMAAITAQKWLAADVLVLDTESTGLDYSDQVVEIAIVDVRGQVLLDTRLRPTVPVGQGAQNIHGISAEQLINAPTWSDIAQQLCKILEGRKVIAFNSSFDSRLLQQTAKANADDYWAWNVDHECAMDLAALAFGATNRYGSISLNSAVDKAGIEWKGEAHSALGDALTTLALIKTIAGHGNGSDVSFTYNDKHYPDIYRAVWYRNAGYIDLFPRGNESGQYTTPYDVTSCITELVELLEASGIPVERKGELMRFDLDMVALSADVPEWRKALEHAQVQEEGDLDWALRSHIGVYQEVGSWTLEPDEDRPLELVSEYTKRRFPVLAKINQDNGLNLCGDYFFTEKFCWCPDGYVLGLIPEDQWPNQKQGGH